MYGSVSLSLVLCSHVWPRRPSHVRDLLLVLRLSSPPRPRAPITSEEEGPQAAADQSGEIIDAVHSKKKTKL